MANKTKHLLVRINAEHKKKFKELCDLRGEKMSENIERHILDQINDSGENRRRKHQKED